MEDTVGHIRHINYMVRNLEREFVFSDGSGPKIMIEDYCSKNWSYDPDSKKVTISFVGGYWNSFEVLDVAKGSEVTLFSVKYDTDTHNSYLAVSNHKESHEQVD
jgi:hypothetical protein